MRKLLLTILVPMLLASCWRYNEIHEPFPIPVANTWKFTTGDDPAYALDDYDDTQWETVTSDQSWESQGFENYDGYAWYRKTVNIPERIGSIPARYNAGFLLGLGEIHQVSEIYINGKQFQINGSFPPAFEQDLGPGSYLIPSQYWKYNDDNVIAVRVFNEEGTGGIISDEVVFRSYTVMDQLEISGIVRAESGIFLSDVDSIRVDVSVENRSKSLAEVNLVSKFSSQAGGNETTSVIPISVYPTKSFVTSFSHKPLNAGFYNFDIYLEKNNVEGEHHRFTIAYKPEAIPVSYPANTIRSAIDSARRFTDSTEVSLQRNIKMLNRGTLTEIKLSAADESTLSARLLLPIARGERKAPLRIEYLPSDRLDEDVDFRNLREATFRIYVDTLKTSYFHRFTEIFRAMDYAMALNDIDPEKIMVYGQAMGGAYAMATAALYPDIAALAVVNPRIADFNVTELLSAVKAPLFMGAGLQDQVSLPEYQFIAYNAVHTPKNYVIYPEQSHSVRDEFFILMEAWLNHIFYPEE